MIKEIQNIFKLFFVLILGFNIVTSCESEPDELGMQFFQTGNAQGTVAKYDVIAYNVFNNNVIEADNDKLSEATLGAFDETAFGMQKASYVTQVRLASYNPDFGKNPVVDSVVLQIKPQYYTTADSIKTVTYENYVHTDNVEAKKVVTTYPIKRYGKYKVAGANANFTINVHEVDDFLRSIDVNFMSDYQVPVGTLLGTKTFDGKLRAIKITKDSDNSELFSREAALRINLDKDFFKNKIVNKKGSFELKDAASFIRYFKGIRISVAENDGYIFNFNPNEITAVMYYSYDKSDTDATRVEGTFSFDLGSSNVHFNQFTYNRPADFNNAMSNINTNTGDKKLYLQGMGGPGAEIKIPESTISTLKDLYKNQKIGILSAKIKLYSDVTTWNNFYEKPQTFVVLTKDVSATSTNYDFLKDIASLQYSGMYKMVNAIDTDKNPASYEIGITQTLKNIIEEKDSNKPISLNIGTFQLSSSGGYLGKDNTTRAYTPNRIVLVGSDPNNTQYKAQLILTYSKK